MGYMHNQHIKDFLVGKTIKAVHGDFGADVFFLEFEDGQQLGLIPTFEKGNAVIIATPFSSKGVVKQTTEIEAEKKKTDFIPDPTIENPVIHEPIISIDRQAKSFAVFDGFDLVRDFQPYTNEEEALTIARQYCKQRTDKEPEVKYPRIKKMVCR